MDGSSQGTIDPVRIGADQLLQTFLAPSPDGARAMVVAVDGDPKLADPRDWAGAVYNGRSLGRQDRNLYACAARIRPDANGHFRRRQEQAIPAVLVIDDVGHGAGSKVNPERLANLTPSAVIATSPGNTQWLLRLTADCTLEDVQRLYRALKRAGLTDPGAADAVRLFRLPGGLNLKPSACSPNGGPWRVRCTAWNPSWDYHTSEIADLLGLDLTEPTPVSRPTASPDFDRERETEALRCIPPSVGRDEWFRIGCGLHHATNGSDEGLDLFESWSNGELTGAGPPKNYVEGDCERTWRSLGRPRADVITLATVHQIAQRHGWAGLAVQAFADVDAEEKPVEDGRDEAPKQPTWREIERAQARQAVQNLAGGSIDQTAPYASVAAAFRDLSATLILSPPASGKSRETIALARQYLERDDPEEMLIVFTASYALMTEIAGPLALEVGEARAGLIAYVTQNDPLLPFVEAQTDQRPYRVVVCSHATALPRGNDISSTGRVLAKAVNAKDLVERNRLRPLHITIVVDEVDVLLQQLIVQLPLGLREIKTTDSVMETPVCRAVGARCPENCPECRPLLDFATHARGMRQGKGLVLGLRPKYPLPQKGERLELDLGWLRAALKPPTFVKGYADQEIDAGLLPPEDAKPLFDTVPGAQGVGLRARPNPEGIIRELASRPGASVRYGVVRDKATGQAIDPADVTAEMDVIHPRNSCVPYLMSWNPRPLAEMRAVSDRLILASATVGKTSMAMIEETLGPVKVAQVAIPPERKMEEVLLIGVSRWTLESASTGALVAASPLLILHRYAEGAREHADRIAGWRGQHGILPATWSRRGAECDVQGRFNLLSAPIRSAIGRGVNLPFFRTLLTWADCYISARNAFAFGHADLPEAIESERLDTLIQGATRIMRWDVDAKKEGRPPDDGRRVIIVVLGEDDEHNTSEVFLNALAGRLRGNAKRFHVRNYQTFPSRALQAALEFWETGRVTVDDKPVGNASTMSRRQRERTKDEREALKAAAKAAKRETLKTEKMAKAEAMKRAGEPWRKIRNTLNLGKFFSEEEIESLKNQ